MCNRDCSVVPWGKMEWLLRKAVKDNQDFIPERMCSGWSRYKLKEVRRKVLRKSGSGVIKTMGDRL